MKYIIIIKGITLFLSLLLYIPARAAELSTLDNQYIKELEAVLVKADESNQKFVVEYKKFNKEIDSWLGLRLRLWIPPSKEELSNWQDNLAKIYPNPFSLNELLPGGETIELHGVATLGLLQWYRAGLEALLACFEAWDVVSNNYEECPPLTKETAVDKGLECRKLKLNKIFTEMRNSVQEKVSMGDSLLQEVRDDISYLKRTGRSKIKQELNK